MQMKIIEKIRSEKKVTYGISIAVLLSIFLVDLSLPLGLAIWVFYSILILVSIWLKDRLYLFVITALCSVLIVAKIVILQDDPLFGMGVLNRSVGIIFVWIVWWLCKIKINADIQLAGYVEKLNLTIENKEKMIKILAHDLKSPFLGLIGYSEIIVEECESKSITSIIRPARQLYALANDTFEMLCNLLDWARSRPGRIEIRLEDISIRELTENILKISRKRASIKGVQILNLTHEDALTHADNVLLSIVLRNLINNAIKYTFPGGIIKIETGKNLNFVEVSVTDDGIGIDPERLKTLFTDKNRVSEPGTNMEGGTGLGLSFCHEIVTRNGGKIWVESKPGRGSRFVFSTPCAKLVDKT